MMLGVILYGPPAAGKDTVTEALTRLDSRFRMYNRLKVGGGKTATYRIVEPGTLQTLRERQEIIWENSRYGATYAIDRPGLRDALRTSVPILHIGQPEAVAAVLADELDAQWLVVELRCSREIAAARLLAREPEDVAERLAVWDETAALPGASVRVDTGKQSADEVAQVLSDLVDAGGPRE